MRMLVGDIGGTNARLIMYEATEEQLLSSDPTAITHHKVISQMYYKNNDFESFSDIMWQFMNLEKNRTVKVNSCCFAVAGPVNNNQINFTNREGWIVNGNTIQQEMDIEKVQLINDFVANGHGVLTLSEKELVTLQKGASRSSGTDPIALLGAGTGLGECFLTPCANGEMGVYPTEGGHVEFAPRTPFEMELLSFIQQRLKESDGGKPTIAETVPRVSVERVVSGKGLENIYEFLRETCPDQVDSAMDEIYNGSTERGRLIGHEKYNYSLFKRTIEIMFGIFGGEAGNVALKYLPYGGVYIAGGIAPKNIEFITNQDSEFMHRFLEKGRMSSIMADFPVHVVMKDDLGLRGAHTVASRLCRDMLRSGNGDVHRVDVDKQTAVEISRPAPNLGLDFTEAIQRYPLAYAVAMSITAALTAGSFAATQWYLRNK